MNRERELAQTIIDAWNDDKLKGSFWHDVVYKRCYPIINESVKKTEPVVEIQCIQTGGPCYRVSEERR